VNDGNPDTRETMRGIRRHWRAVVAVTALALVLGAAYASVRPRWNTARSLVLLPPSASTASGEPTRDSDTQVLIATSSRVIDDARALVHRPADAQTHVSASALTSDIIAIRVRARDSRDAVAFANAVAKSYVQYSTGALSDRTDATVGTLTDELNGLKAQAAELQAQITQRSNESSSSPPRTPPGANDSNELATLQTRLAATNKQIDTLNNQIGTAQLGSALSDNGTRVLERATSASGPSVLWKVEPALLAAVAGLAVGALVAIRINARDRRVRRRDDLARAVGAPVVTSLRAKPLKHRQWSEFLEHYEPGVFEEWSTRQTVLWLNRHDPARPRQITLVTLEGDASALVAAAKLAVCTATLGERTLFALATRNATAAGLRAACGSTVGEPCEVRSNLRVVDAAALDDCAYDDVDIVVTLVIAEDGIVELPRWTRSAPVLVCVTAGFAPGDSITMVALSAATVAREPAGTIVVNPEPHDDSGGRPAPFQEPDPFVHPTRITGGSA
jgi:capsular polysaccharide biosynthesis protein